MAFDLIPLQWRFVFSVVRKSVAILQALSSQAQGSICHGEYWEGLTPHGRKMCRSQQVLTMRHNDGSTMKKLRSGPENAI
jgi:hypothetical protein